MYRFEKDRSLIGNVLDVISCYGFSVRVNKNTLELGDCDFDICGNCLFNDAAKLGGNCELGWLQWLLEEVDEDGGDTKGIRL